MAISPKEAAVFMDAQIKGAIESLEKRIDEQLRIKWHSDSPRVMVLVNTRDWKTPTAAYHVANKYAKQGWTIDSGEETEDGFTVHFGVIR